MYIGAERTSEHQIVGIYKSFSTRRFGFDSWLLNDSEQITESLWALRHPNGKLNLCLPL